MIIQFGYTQTAVFVKENSSLCREKLQFAFVQTEENWGVMGYEFKGECTANRVLFFRIRAFRFEKRIKAFSATKGSGRFITAV